MKLSFVALVFLIATPFSAKAESLNCVSTTFNLLSPNDKVCVTHFEDPHVPGVTCYVSQARKGGWGSALGLNEDPSHFAVSCRQTGPITVDISKLDDDEEVFGVKTSVFFKRTRIYRLIDVEHKTLVYLAISGKIVSGSPANSISVVPIRPWGS